MSDRGPQEARVEVTVNGEPRAVAAGATVLDLLATVGRDPRTVAVEHNGRILPRARYGETVLAAGDRLEVVHFVQGGGGPGGCVRRAASL